MSDDSPHTATATEEPPAMFNSSACKVSLELRTLSVLRIKAKEALRDEDVGMTPTKPPY